LTEGQKKSTWFLWLVVIPPMFYFIAEQTYDVWLVSWTPIAAFTILIIIASLFPIQLKHASLIPLHGISLAIFLHYGILIEVFVTQIALVTTLSRLKLPKQELYRFPLNSLIFLTTSLGAGGMFFYLGGYVGEVTPSDLMTLWFPILAYVTTYFLINNGLIYLMRRWLLQMRHVKFFDEALKWEAVTGVLILPVGLILAILFQEVGYIAVLMMGIPIVSVSLILRIYNESKKTAGLLKKASKFGYEVNDRLTEDEILELFIDTCVKVFPNQGISLYECSEENSIRPIYQNDFSGKSDLKITQGDTISKSVCQVRESVLYSSKSQWRTFEPTQLKSNVQSILSTPSIRNHKVIAVVTITSDRKNAFKKEDQTLLEIISNYLTVALQNARYIDKTKQESERCLLTNLYNFKYFERLLLDEFSSLKKHDDYAIILLDLDHFKNINDTYGHQSGNDVLVEVASVLLNTVEDEAIVARYGGEEFVLLVENTSLDRAYKLAETLRVAIEINPFTVSEDLENGESKTVHITASIGVATKIEDDESPISVLRNADRAMYTGAKQKGRNKVAQLT
jgi:diguanylate cyclase (GGDEF)-like protein